MPITLVEKLDSRRVTLGENPSVELVYILTGTADDAAAVAAIEAAAPLIYQGLFRQGLQLDPQWVDENSGDGQWVATVRYGPRPLPKWGESIYSFDTTGGTQHITQSIETVNQYAPPGKTAPDFKGAIGVTPDNVEGVDITVPVCSFAETHYLPAEIVTMDYRVTLFRLTGKVNNDTFKGCAAGECLFLGATGSKRGSDDWEITYRFAVSPNRDNITIGDITGIDKKGWEYLWVRYEDAEDTDAKVLIKKPIAAYVEKVYEEADFSILGIGV